MNAVLETARDLNTVAMVQISHGGSHFYAGKSLDNGDWSASVAGALSMAQHVYHVAGKYEVPVILHLLYFRARSAMKHQQNWFGFVVRVK